MKKRYWVVLFFLLASVACFFIQYWIAMQLMVTKIATKVDAIVAILHATLVATLSLIIYSVTMTLIAVTGFLISSKRKNEELKAGFKISSLIAVIATLLLGLDIFVLHW